MFEKKYKADNERIEPTRESLLSLSYKMKREQAKKKDKKKAEMDSSRGGGGGGFGRAAGVLSDFSLLYAPRWPDPHGWRGRGGRSRGFPAAGPEP